MGNWFPFIKKGKENNEASSSQLIKVEQDEKEPLYPSVPIRDIKEYLVDEFDKSRSLEEQLIEKEEKIDALKITENKYKATLATLDEYSKRLEKKDNRIEEVKRKVELKQKEIDDLNEKVNDLKINAYRKEEFREEVIRETKSIVAQSIVQRIDNHSGVLPKGLMKEWLDDIQDGQTND